MEYINEININQAVIHILDLNATDPVINEYPLELNEDTYLYIYKHLEKCFKDEELKYAIFNEGNNSVRDHAQDFLTGVNDDFIEVSKKMARHLFGAMRSAGQDVHSADLMVISIVTDQGPMVAILKMDYVKNFTHEVNFIDEKIEIGIIPQNAGLPGNGQRIQKAAFIKLINEDERYNLMVIDKKKASKEEDPCADYFLGTFLNAKIVTNERDMTKTFVKAAEEWTRKNITDNAVKAEEVRTAVKTKLKGEDSISLEEFSEELFKDKPQVKEDFTNYIKAQGIEKEVAVDKTWVDKKFKRVRLNIDKKIDLYINEETYHDKSKFEIVRNGDGSINLVVKNVINYIEK